MIIELTFENIEEYLEAAEDAKENQIKSKAVVGTKLVALFTKNVSLYQLTVYPFMILDTSRLL